jgi:plastocyanin
MEIKRFAAAVLVAGVAAGACTVHQTEVPPLAGPSDLATSVNVTATPDTIKLGLSPTALGESSQVLVQMFGPDGAPAKNRSVRVDIAVGNSFADCGQLSARDLVTGSDGRAATVFTAPTQPLPQPECASFSPGGTVTIVATPVGTNFQTSTQRTATIRMVLPTIIQGPGAASVNFTISPPTAKVGDEVTFSDAGSTGSVGCSPMLFQWYFSDGITKNGASVQHDFTPAGTYTATLVVTDSCGNEASKSASITISS